MKSRGSVGSTAHSLRSIRPPGSFPGDSGSTPDTATTAHEEWENLPSEEYIHKEPCKSCPFRDIIGCHFDFWSRIISHTRLTKDCPNGYYHSRYDTEMTPWVVEQQVYSALGKLGSKKGRTSRELAKGINASSQQIVRACIDSPRIVGEKKNGNGLIVWRRADE